MNCASARCSRARSPRRNEKRAPDIFAAVAKSSRPSASPRSVWSFAGKSNSGGVPQRRTSTLSSADLPTGVDGCVEVGQVEQEVAQLRLHAIELALEPLQLVAEAGDFGQQRRGVLALALGDADLLRQRVAPAPAAPACASGCPCARASSASKRAVSSATPRLASPAATAARSLRKRLMSSIASIISEAYGLTTPVAIVGSGAGRRACTASSCARRRASFSRIFASSPRSVGA